MPPPKKLDEKTIVEKYVNGDAGIVEIAKQHGVCHKTIKRVLLNHGITVKSGGTILPHPTRGGKVAPGGRPDGAEKMKE